MSRPKPQHCEVTVLWIHDKQEDKHWNVLTIIEEIHPSQKPAQLLETIDQNGKHHPLKQAKLKSSQLLLNAFRFRFENTAVAEAFFQCRSGIRQFELGGKEIKVHPLSQEVLYPGNGELSVPPASAVCLGEVLEPLQQVLPRRNVTSQARVQLVSPTIEDIIPFKEHFTVIVDQAKEWLGTDLEKARELLGSTIWSRPNPYLYNMTWGLLQQGKAVLLEAYLRPGIEALDMIVTAWGNGSIGREPYFQSRWNGGPVCFPVPSSRGSIDIKVHNIDGELLEDRRGSFIHTINLESRISSGSRQVAVKQVDGLIATQNVTRWSAGSEAVIGEADHTITALNQEEKVRQQRRLLDRGEFLYVSSFDQGAAQQAEDYVRGLFRRVKSRCIVADPYFGASELQGFALFVGSVEARIDLITSHSFLSYKVNESANNEGDQLASKLEQLVELDPMFRPRITVLKGRDAPPLHDRFLVIDDSVFHLGGSLNHLGRRAMAISRVPAPEPVLADLERWINGEHSDTFDTWLENNG